MRSEDFEPGQVFIFHYPYVTTPCFIFNLGESQEQTEVMHTKKWVAVPLAWRNRAISIDRRLFRNLRT